MHPDSCVFALLEMLETGLEEGFEGDRLNMLREGEIDVVKYIDRVRENGRRSAGKRAT